MVRRDPRTRRPPLRYSTGSPTLRFSGEWRHRFYVEEFIGQQTGRSMTLYVLTDN